MQELMRRVVSKTRRGIGPGVRVVPREKEIAQLRILGVPLQSYMKSGEDMNEIVPYLALVWFVERIITSAAVVRLSNEEVGSDP
jgi:hypothetical protein